MTSIDTLNKGTYAAVKPSPQSADNITRAAIELGIPGVIEPSEIHCTLLYSRKYVPLSGTIDVDYKSLISNFELFGENKEILVITLISKDLSERHKYLMDTYNATYDFETYIPHITLSYNIGEFDINKIDISDFNEDLNFITEYYEDLDLNY